MASIVNDYRPGQVAANHGSLVSICLEQLGDSNALLRQWLCLCLARLWHNYDKARWCGVRDIAHEKLFTLLQDPVPEVIELSYLKFCFNIYIYNDNDILKRGTKYSRFEQLVFMLWEHS